jgi:hypothetical protein
MLSTTGNYNGLTLLFIDFRQNKNIMQTKKEKDKDFVRDGIGIGLYVLNKLQIQSHHRSS